MATLLEISGENSPFSQEEFTKLHPYWGRVATSLSTGYSLNDPTQMCRQLHEI
jgi:hypothetical protein